RVANRTKQGEAPALAIDRVLSRRERHVAAGARLALPDAEPNQLQPLERAGRKVQLRVCELSRWVPFVVGKNLDRHGVSLLYGAGSWVRSRLKAAAGIGLTSDPTQPPA